MKKVTVECDANINDSGSHDVDNTPLVFVFAIGRKRLNVTWCEYL